MNDRAPLYLVVLSKLYTVIGRFGILLDSAVLLRLATYLHEQQIEKLRKMLNDR